MNWVWWIVRGYAAFLGIMLIAGYRWHKSR